MDTPYRLKIKVGPHEFEAEGSAEDVREQFQAFKEMIAVVPVTPAPNPQTTPPPVPITDGATPEKTDVPSGDLALSKIMKLEGRTISLTVRPKTLVEAILLILLGQKLLRQNDSVTGAEILDGLKTTGGLAFGRIDRVMENIGKDGDVIVTGENRGKRYRMTNAGVAKARRLAAELI